ncbi:MAG TPA: hypothetical protein VL523_02550 [Terriglobia bacterium]|nr:hypothetical protein [Terriglobia bacterium]
MLTFHKIIRQCADGDRQAWGAFVAEYTPFFTGLLAVYLREEGGSQGPAAWSGTLEDLAADTTQCLRSLAHQSEKEFLLDLRRLVLGRAALSVPDEPEAQAPSSPPDARARGVVEGLPLVHQQVVFLKLTGYSDEALERLLRITPGVAKQGFERLRSNDRFSRADWFRVLKAAWSSHTDSCPAPRLLIRIQDGQVSWYDRDPVERHIVTCLHCLELWTALGEVRHWRREVHPLTSAEAEHLVASLPLKSSPAKGHLGLAGLFKLRRS